jgi:C-terminal processing protease CtpA/Prc
LINTRGEVLPKWFMDADICGATVAAAMGFVAHTDALILDLRDNGGGQPAMVSLIASYLFDKPTHLNDLYDRHENSTTQYWTLAWVPGERMPTQPVFVLTSHRTFSGGEEFTYDLKTQKRATIVGETTGGGEHPVAGHPAADYFMIGVPFATAINPITKTSWEGTGVEPDVKVAADDALTTAEKLAANKIHAVKIADHGDSEPMTGYPAITTQATACHRSRNRDRADWQLCPVDAAAQTIVHDKGRYHSRKA